MGMSDSMISRLIETGRKAQQKYLKKKKKKRRLPVSKICKRRKKLDFSMIYEHYHTCSEDS